MNYKLKISLIISSLIFTSNFVFAQESQLSVSFSVLTDEARFYPNLKKDDIRVLHKKELLEINSIKSSDNQNIDLVVMIDLSMSQEVTLPFVKKIAQSFINSYLKEKRDRVAVVGFTGEVHNYQNLTNDYKVAIQSIEKLEIKFPDGYQSNKLPRGVIIGTPSSIKKDEKKFSTAIWDSIKSVSENNFHREKSETQKVILLITDGVDTTSDIKKRTAIEFAIKNNVRVYAIGMGDGAYQGVSKKDLKDITSSTGGLSFVPKITDELPKIFQSIEQSLRSNYIIVFNKTPLTKKGLNEIKLEIINSKVLNKKVQLIQSKGFMSP
jgi:Ca-activated chloride channel homolog